MVSHLVLLLGLGLAVANPVELVERACATPATVWAQCGGIGWAGSTCCAAGNTCSTLNSYYFQCVPATSTSAAGATSTGSTKVTTTGTTSKGTTTSVSTSSTAKVTGATIYTTTSAFVTNATHSQSAYPAASSGACGSWTLVDNVCCPSYCGSVNTSESCSIAGLTAAQCDCTTPPSADCKSGTMYPEVHSVGANEAWHYSINPFRLDTRRACGFGLYGLCTKGSTTASWTDPMLGSTCTAFCTAYPILCQDPSTTTLRGNLAAPNGDYYTQFWPSLVGDLDNYLSCGECMEVIQTKPDGTDYAVGEAGYTPPIVLEILDSCPCSANSKWCCGPGADHCGEINFKYGCPLPAGSIHLDLSDIAMGRLQGNGSLTNGVIPTRYKRVPCPTPGNVYIWLRDNGGPYYFALTAVNTAGIGSVVKIEIQGSGTSTWTPLIHDPNYTEARPQERYGAWVMPQGSGPFNVPIAMRLTSASGEQLVNMAAIKSFTAPASAPAQANYIDLGMQFTK